jgi:curved DNA-binding protein CbpA
MRVGEQVGKAHAQVLALAPGFVPTSLSLDPAEGYLLSRIDGHTSWGTLRQIGALPPQEVDRMIELWLKDGVIVMGAGGRGAAQGATQASPNAQHGAAEHKPPVADAAAAKPVPILAVARPPALPEIDASLELEVELQQEVLDFARGLGRRYHEILGVAHDADAKALKKAYFALSKRLHPDRYFRRNTGPFGPLIETCFKRLLEAYELLSDPTTRKEVQSGAQDETRLPRDLMGAAKARGASLDARRRLRERVSSLAGHVRAREERRRKAKGFYENGMSAFAAERWLEAAGSVRLAIAFDPENSAYRESFPDVQRKAHGERAKHLVKQAEGALEMRDYAAALDHFEEALHFRPGDAELAFRTAKLAVQVGADPKRAKDFAAQAVEVAPDNAAYRTLLGAIYKSAGLTANAKRELEAALRLDPQNREAKRELRSL